MFASIKKVRCEKVEKIKEYLKDNVDVLKDMVSEVYSYNGYLEDYIYYENSEDFFENYFSSKSEVARAICFGKYNFSDEYVKFNAYGNLESVSEYDIESELIDGLDEIFDNWYDLYQNNQSSMYIDSEFEQLLEETVTLI